MRPSSRSHIFIETEPGICTGGPSFDMEVSFVAWGEVLFDELALPRQRSCWEDHRCGSLNNFTSLARRERIVAIEFSI